MWVEVVVTVVGSLVAGLGWGALAFWQAAIPGGAVGAVLLIGFLTYDVLRSPYWLAAHKDAETARLIQSGEEALEVEHVQHKAALHSLKAMEGDLESLHVQLRDVQRALDYGFQVPVRLEVLKQYASSVRATMIGDWFDELVAQAKLGDAHAKAHIPTVATALMDTMADWGASPGRAKATAKVEAAMQDLGLPWTRPLEPGET